MPTMTPYDTLQELIARDLARVTWEPAHYDEAWDIDLNKGVDANGYTIDRGMLADNVRDLQNGTIESLDCAIELREPPCTKCGHDPGWTMVASLGCIWLGKDADRDKLYMAEVESDLADDAADELREALDAANSAAT